MQSYYSGIPRSRSADDLDNLSFSEPGSMSYLDSRPYSSRRSPSSPSIPHPSYDISYRSYPPDRGYYSDFDYSGGGTGTPRGQSSSDIRIDRRVLDRLNSARLNQLPQGNHSGHRFPLGFPTRTADNQRGSRTRTRSFSCSPPPSVIYPDHQSYNYGQHPYRGSYHDPSNLASMRPRHSYRSGASADYRGYESDPGYPSPLYFPLAFNVSSTQFLRLGLAA